MAAPTQDRVLPPLVFLSALLSIFIALSASFSPSIQEAIINEEDGYYVKIPDYLSMFENATTGYWTPFAYVIDRNKLSDEWSIDKNEGRQTVFTIDIETMPAHKITMYAIKHISFWKHNIVRLHFEQKGGWLGLKLYVDQLQYPEDFQETLNETQERILNYYAYINLHRTYLVTISPLPENETDFGDWCIQNWYFTVTIWSLQNQTQKTNPWAIVGQFFSFRLPHIPMWLNVMIAAPIWIIIGVTAYILIRGALPA